MEGKGGWDDSTNSTLLHKNGGGGQKFPKTVHVVYRWPRGIFYLSFKGKFDKPAATFICRGNQAGGWHSLVQTKTKIAFGIKMHRGRDYLLIVILNTSNTSKKLDND